MAKKDTPLSNEDYHNAPGISSSDFRLLKRSPLHLDNKHLFKLNGNNFLLGTLVHKMVLEPETLKDEFIEESFKGADISTNTIAYNEALPLIEAFAKKDTSSYIKAYFPNCDANKNSKLYKESKAIFMEEAKEQGMTVVSMEIWALAEDVDYAITLVGNRTRISVTMWKQAEAMAHNVLVIAGGLLQNGHAEKSFFVEDAEYDIVRKCRPDYYREDLGIVIDLKTTVDGSVYGFAKSIHAYAYHRQSAWYLDTLTKARLSVDRFIFITVESTAPYMVEVLEIDPVSIDKGQTEYETLLREYAEYKKTGIPNLVKTVSLPDWAFKDG